MTNKIGLKIFLAIKTLFICIPITMIAIIIANNCIIVNVNDSDLIFNPTRVQDTDNAYIKLLPTLRKLHETKPYSKEGVDAMLKDMEKGDYSKLKQLTDQWSPFLMALSESLELNSFRVPLEENISEHKYEKYTSELSLLRKMAYLDIKETLQEGKMEETASKIKNLFEYGYYLETSEGGFIYFILGALSKLQAMECAQAWIMASHLDSSYYKQFIKDIEKYSDNNAMADSLKIEYTMLRKTLKGLVEKSIVEDAKHKEFYERYKNNPAKMRYFYNEGATINKAAEYFRQEIKNISGPYACIKHKEIYHTPNVLMQDLYLIFGNAIGKYLLQMSVPRFSRGAEQNFKIYAKFQIVKLLAALKAYYVEKNSLPADIHELTPNYISNIPRDPYDGKELKYSKAQKIIYSTGPDTKDGSPAKEKSLCGTLNF